MDVKTRGGWAMPDREKVAHYFAGTGSLCHRWEYGGPVTSLPFDLAGLTCGACTQALADRFVAR